MANKIDKLRDLFQEILEGLEFLEKERRDLTALAMKKRSAKAGAHKDQKKEANKKKARKRVDQNSDE